MADKQTRENELIKIYSSSDDEDDGPLPTDVSEEDASSSISCDNDSDSGYDGSEFEEEEENTGTRVHNDEESIYNRVLHFLRGRLDLGELSLTECKAYLRKYGLRLSGTKAECMERIEMHWRIKDGRGEELYPRSSFSIDCTGDVCKGDVCLFTQKVYQTFDKVTRRGSPIGKRTVAGRVVKESYGAGKQQHTFTGEVLWSKGVKKLPPLFPLLVKGRNLYKLRTFRQPWKSENQRSEVLAEKHKRGTEARLIRDMRREKTIRNTKKSTGTKRPKHFHQFRPSAVKETANAGKNHIAKHGKALATSRNSNHERSSAPFRSSRVKQQEPRGPKSHWSHHNLNRSNLSRDSQYTPYAYAPHDFHYPQSERHHRTLTDLAWDRGFAPPRGQSSPHPRQQAPLQGGMFRRGNNYHAYSHSSYVTDSRNFTRHPR